MNMRRSIGVLLGLSVVGLSHSATAQDQSDKTGVSSRQCASPAPANCRAAINAYSEAVQRTPTFARHYRQRGDAYSGVGDLDGAIVDYTAAIGLTALQPRHRLPRQRRLRSGRGRLHRGHRHHLRLCRGVLQPRRRLSRQERLRSGHRRPRRCHPAETDRVRRGALLPEPRLLPKGRLRSGHRRLQSRPSASTRKILPGILRSGQCLCRQTQLQQGHRRLYPSRPTQSEIRRCVFRPRRCLPSSRASTMRPLPRLYERCIRDRYPRGMPKPSTAEALPTAKEGRDGQSPSGLRQSREVERHPARPPPQPDCRTPRDCSPQRDRSPQQDCRPTRLPPQLRLPPQP